ncbi:hypothetical protein GGR08_000818 [Bartonella fuyuanensis]|uniref:Uncharacterized protein n=1 Tax=Bartonella fuyuanensis TaxID=1460968 RepID=A0A840E2W6_9HYPH|nr:hypothetical protein [Bartonella fuyuanensis]MBB4076518.1 hypothetical protein [Bartonella fuyuanensis]
MIEPNEFYGTLHGRCHEMGLGTLQNVSKKARKLTNRWRSIYTKKEE